MMTDDQKRVHAREVDEELEKMYRDRAIAEGRLVLPEIESSSDAPSRKKETPLEKLARANRGSIVHPTHEVTLTESDRRGLSWDEFKELRPELRLEMYEIANLNRQKAKG